MFSIFKKDTAPKRRFTHLQIFTIEVPESWRQNDNPKYLALSDPAGVAAITGNAFAKKERGSVTDFAESRFGAVAEMEFYSQTGDESRLRVNGHDFITANTKARGLKKQNPPIMFSPAASLTGLTYP